MIKLHCQHKDAGGSRCNTCVATIQNGVLVLPFRHENEAHTLVVTLADLMRLMEQDKQHRERALRV